jgi:hypothetical protein
MDMEASMKFYTRQHKHYCGIDLHARSMYVYVLDQAGVVLVHKNIAAAPEPLLGLIGRAINDSELVDVTVCGASTRSEPDRHFARPPAGIEWRRAVLTDPVRECFLLCVKPAPVPSAPRTGVNLGSQPPALIATVSGPRVVSAASKRSASTGDEKAVQACVASDCQ